MTVLTASQKRYLEWPLITLLVCAVQIFEISSWRYLGSWGYIHFCSVIVAYISLTRDILKTTLLSFLFATLFCSSTGIISGIYISSIMWTALIAKFLVYSFALEGRLPFTILSTGFNILFTLFVISAYTYKGYPLGFWFESGNVLLSSLYTFLISWLIFPFFVTWDYVYEHEPDDARRLESGSRLR